MGGNYLREYECLYILIPDLAPEDTEPLIERFGQVITDNGGELLSTNPWGKRRLAYEIGRAKEGFYVQVRFNGEETTCKELDRAMRFSESALRHLIVRAEDLDPADTAIPEQLPEPGTDDWEDRRGYRRRRDEASPAEAAAEAAAEAEAEAGAEDSTEAAGEEEATPDTEADAGAEAGGEEEAPAEAEAAEPTAEEPAAEEPTPAEEQPTENTEEG